MATGDGEIVAKKIAKHCGITEYIAGAFPEQKAELVKQLKSQGHTVAVIGDGINDSPALPMPISPFLCMAVQKQLVKGPILYLLMAILRRFTGGNSYCPRRH